MDWRLRPATVADAPALALVAGAAFLEAFAGVLDGAAVVAHCVRHHHAHAYAAFAADPAVTLVIAEAATGGAPLGYTLLAPADLAEAGEGDLELRRIYTLAVGWGSGLGAALMARAVEDARARGATRLLLGVNVRNARALAFYARQGFERVGARRFLMGDAWQDDHVLAKTL